MDLLSLFATEFDIPIIDDNQRVWFFRTKAGQFYYDFQVNQFIGLGWELVDAEVIRNVELSYEAKKAKIEDLYPNEKRPGLILGQMDTFYNKMQIGDFVVIPSAGGKEIAIGKIGDFISEVMHRPSEEEYPTCNYSHKRSVKWVKRVKSWQDIYLFKALRAQQTISDITEEAELVFRNLFPAYIAKDTIHISLQKESQSELGAVDNVALQSGILEILNETAKLYGRECFQDEVCIKTAVGSPGFLEMILPRIPVAEIAATIIVRILSGTIKSNDGTVTSGIPAIIMTFNNLLNDYHNRKKVDAEVKQMEADTRLKDAQADRERAEAEKLRAETKLLNAQATNPAAEISEKTKFEQISFTSSGKTTVQEKEEQEQLKIADAETTQCAVCRLEQSGEKMCAAAANCGMTYDGKEIRKRG